LLRADLLRAEGMIAGDARTTAQDELEARLRRSYARDIARWADPRAPFGPRS
jgi:hypothetical protein